MSKTYRSKIAAAESSFELSCIWEEVRDAFWNRKTISREMYEKRSKEIIDKRDTIRG
jgi:hypothetical protein